MITAREERESAFTIFMEKMIIAEKMVEQQGYYSEEEVEEALANI